MSTLAIVLIVLGRPARDPVLHRRRARACAPGRATRRRPSTGTCGRPTRRSSRRGRSDRGWHRDTMEAAAHAAIARGSRPGWTYDDLQLVLVDDRPGVEEDRAHFVAGGADGQARVDPRPPGRPVAGRAGRLDREAELLAAGDARVGVACGAVRCARHPCAAARRGRPAPARPRQRARPARSRRAAGVAAGARPAAPPATMRRTAARPATGVAGASQLRHALRSGGEGTRGAQDAIGVRAGTRRALRTRRSSRAPARFAV